MNLRANLFEASTIYVGAFFSGLQNFCFSEWALEISLNTLLVFSFEGWTSRRRVGDSVPISSAPGVVLFF